MSIIAINPKDLNIKLPKIEIKGKFYLLGKENKNKEMILYDFKNEDIKGILTKNNDKFGDKAYGELKRRSDAAVKQADEKAIQLIICDSFCFVSLYWMPKFWTRG